MLILSIFNSVVVALAVLVHYEFLRLLSGILPRLRVRYRFRIAFGVIGSLCGHTAAIWIFAFAYYFMIHHMTVGTLYGDPDLSLVTCAYFSFTTYSSLGYGDIVPIGDLRYLAGLEALTGLVMIAWTASFLYYEMERYWRE